MTRGFTFLVVGLLAASVAGCAQRRLASQSGPPGYYSPPPPPRYVGQPPPGALIVPPGSVPPGSVPPGNVPPGAFPTAPSSPPPAGFPTAPPSPPLNNFPTTPPMAPPGPPPGPSSAIPNDVRDRVGYRWEPVGPQNPPVAAPPSNQPPQVLLLPPAPDSDVAPRPPEPKQEPKQEPRPQLYPPATKEPPVAQSPVGIFGFDRARDSVATGQRPTLEGLDWLQKSGYKVVVFLHLPNEMVDTDRQQVEKRDMKFVAIEINPRDMSRESLDRFLKVQTDNRGEKVFVYDLDGSLAGAMWYASFRLIDQNEDDAARVRANSLGMSENRDAARDLWQSVRKLVEQK